VALDVVQLPADLLDLLADQPAVGLELALAGTSGADSAGGAGQVGPQPGQPRQVVFQRRQLDLEPSLAGARMPREDVDDQRRAVQHLAVQELLQAALLIRGQLVVDDQQVEATRRLLIGQLRGAALAEVPHRIGLRPSLEGTADHRGAGGLGQGTELLQAALDRPAPVGRVVEADEEGALGRRGEVNQAAAFGHLFGPC